MYVKYLVDILKIFYQGLHKVALRVSNTLRKFQHLSKWPSKATHR